MLNTLPPRERQIVDLLYVHGAMAVAEVCEALPDKLSASAVRAMLTRLEQKGVVERRMSERGYLFSPVEAESKASVTALGHVVRTFFNGSTTNAASALLGMSEKLDDEDLDELEAMIAAARAKKGA